MISHEFEVEEGALRSCRCVDEAERAQRLSKPAVRLGVDQRRMQHEVSDAFARDAKILRERACEHGVLVEVERLDALMRWICQPPVHLVDDQQDFAVVFVVVRVQHRGKS